MATPGTQYSQHAGQFGPVNGTRRVQSTQDFVIRTNRSSNREQQQRRRQSEQPQANVRMTATMTTTMTAPMAAPIAAMTAMTATPKSGTIIQEACPSLDREQRRLSDITDMSAASPAVSARASWSPSSSQFSAVTPSLARYSAWNRPALIKTSRRRAAEGEIFAVLPGEVLELILDSLQALHMKQGSDSCATCWMRDACSMALAARKMLKYARLALYEHIRLVGADSAGQRKRLRPACGHGTRLILLRRTLRASPMLAAMVRTLAVVPPRAGGPVTDEFQDLVASVVMVCPQLERVDGFFPTYDHVTFRRYFYALATRPRLKSMTWVVDVVPELEVPTTARPRSRGGRLIQTPPSPMVAQFSQFSPVPLMPGQPAAGQPASAFRVPMLSVLDPRQADAFLELHDNWQYLTSLTVHCRPGATLGSDTLLVDALTSLPALASLHLSHIPAASFSDASLLGLPALHRLSLEHVPGVSSAGLSSFASRATSNVLESLALVHVNVDSLQTLARVLSKLARLTALTFVQLNPPTLTPGEVIWLFPYLASASLRRLHWDVPTYPDRANAADLALARSIASDGFPNLRTLRAPADPEGLFQALCKPQERADRPDDRFRPATAGRPAGSPARSESAMSWALPSPPSLRSLESHGRGDSVSSMSSIFSRPFGSHSRTGSGTSTAQTAPSPTTPAFAPDYASAPWLKDEPGGRGHNYSGFYNCMHSDLREARLRAQARIEAARHTPRFTVNVHSDGGVLLENHAVGGYVGALESHIRYLLEPDASASDCKGGLVDMDDLLAEEPMDCCTGRWNANREVAPKKDRERWWHTERGRWVEVVL